MDVNEVLDRARDSITVKRVYGDPIQQGDVIVIPAARIGGGGGGGSGQGPNAQGGTGSGFGIGARPAGAFIISKGRVRWRPALDVNRIILGGQLVAVTALLTIGRLLLARALGRARLRRARLLRGARRAKFLRSAQRAKLLRGLLRARRLA